MILTSGLEWLLVREEKQLSLNFQTVHGILEKSQFCKDMTVTFDSRLRERVSH